MRRLIRSSFITGFWLWGWFIQAPCAFSQSTLNALLAAVDTNNTYIIAGRRCLDSSQTVRLDSRPLPQVAYTKQAHPLKLIRQNRRYTEKSFDILRHKVYLQVRLTCIDLIYQRRRYHELFVRQDQLLQLAHETILMGLKEAKHSNEESLNMLLQSITVKLSQKKALIERNQSELIVINGNQLVNFPDSIYPPNPTKKALFNRMRPLTRLYPEYTLWRNRYIVLRQLMNVDTTSVLNQKSFRTMRWELKTGELELDDLLSQLVSRYQLTDAQMRTERDMHLAAMHLLSYIKKPVH